MMSSLETSSPVSASTFMYLMRWPVFLLIWLKLIFSESEVAGYKATGQVTSERRKKPFQLARGAMKYSKRNRTSVLRRSWSNRSDSQFGVFHQLDPLNVRSIFVLIAPRRWADGLEWYPCRNRAHAPPNPAAAQRDTGPSAGRYLYLVGRGAAGPDAEQS